MKPNSNCKRIAMYGGGFDPIHIAHLILAQTAFEFLQLDRIIFMPSGGTAYYKDESNVASGQQRVEMIRMAIENIPGMEVSSYEVDQNRFCYTIDTLRYLRDTVYPDSEIILLAGGDWKDKIPTWKEGERLIKEFSIAIFSRPGYRHETVLEEESKENRMYYIDMPLIDISSSNIRERRGQGLPIRFRVPDNVHQYIMEKKLYEKR